MAKLVKGNGFIGGKRAIGFRARETECVVGQAGVDLYGQNGRSQTTMTGYEIDDGASLHKLADQQVSFVVVAKPQDGRHMPIQHCQRGQHIPATAAQGLI